jgi:hypothetical protein
MTDHDYDKEDRTMTDHDYDTEKDDATLFGGMFYARGLHNLAGPPGCGKTYVALGLCASVGDAAYLDLDENWATTERLSGLGLSQGLIEATAFDVRRLAHERGESIGATFQVLVDELASADRAPRVVVIDSLDQLMAEVGESSDNADSVTRVLSQLAPLAARTCVVLLDHIPRRVDDRPVGSVAKVGLSRAVLTLKPLSIDSVGHPDVAKASSVLLTKDRDGQIWRHAAPGDESAQPRAGCVLCEGTADTGVTGVRFIPASAVGATA